MGRRGWRVDTVSGSVATVSRPVVWLPVWAHLLLTLGTCSTWALVWALMRRPSMRRSARTVWVTRTGEVVWTSVQS